MVVNSIIVLAQKLKFIEMILKYRNDFEISEFYPSRTFVKVEKMMIFSENAKFPGK